MITTWQDDGGPPSPSTAFRTMLHRRTLGQRPDRRRHGRLAHHWRLAFTSTAATAVVAVATACTGASGPGAGPTTSVTSSSPPVLPGTLIFVDAQKGRPLVLTRVSGGRSTATSFGPTSESASYVASPSPDGTMIALVESPDPGNVEPGDLTIIRAGGPRQVLAHGVTWDWPAWTPDSRNLINHGVQYGIATGRTTTQPAFLNDVAGYLVWSADGRWLAYAGRQAPIVVRNADGTVSHTVSMTGQPECADTPGGCPTSVQAVSDDGRYVSVGFTATDPGHVTTAYLVLDVTTSRSVPVLRSLWSNPTSGRGVIMSIYFRPGGMVVATADKIFLLDQSGTQLASYPRPAVTGRLLGYQP